MRVALIGAGRIGQLHARILAGTDGVEELVVADAIVDRANDVASSVGATAAPSIDAALDQVDAVVVAANTDAHAGLVRQSIGRGLATFCEKPLAGDLAETIAVANEIEAAGVPFQLGFQRRFDAGYAAARRAVVTGDLGTLYAIRLAGHDPAPPPESYIASSGGLFRDFSIHDFDVLRWMTGQEVDRVQADGAVLGFDVFARYEDVDTGAAILRLESGALVVLTSARHDPLGYDIRAELFGSKDSIAVGLSPRTPIRSVEPGVEPSTEPAWPNFQERFAPAYAAELAAFVRVARGDEPSPCTARDGVQALRIAEAVTTARLEGRIVRVAEIPA